AGRSELRGDELIRLDFVFENVDASLDGGDVGEFRRLFVKETLRLEAGFGSGLLVVDASLREECRNQRWFAIYDRDHCFEEPDGLPHFCVFGFAQRAASICGEVVEDDHAIREPLQVRLSKILEITDVWIARIGGF